jgi:hypothetical protein
VKFDAVLRTAQQPILAGYIERQKWLGLLKVGAHRMVVCEPSLSLPFNLRVCAVR